jgi:hypothetical protein
MNLASQVQRSRSGQVRMKSKGRRKIMLLKIYTRDRRKDPINRHRRFGDMPFCYTGYLAKPKELKALLMGSNAKKKASSSRLVLILLPKLTA